MNFCAATVKPQHRLAAKSPGLVAVPRLPTSSRVAKRQNRSVEAQSANEVVQLAWENEQILQIASLTASCILLGVFLGLVFLRIESIYWEKRQEQWRREGRIK